MFIMWAFEAFDTAVSRNWEVGKNRNQYWRLGKSTRYSLCGFLNLIYFAHIKIVTTAVELINFLQSLNYALSHFTKRNSSRCFFSLYYLLNIFSFIFLPRSRQGRWRSEVFLALEIWYLHWSLLLTRAEYFSEPNKLKASARFTFILFECRLSVKSLINSSHTGLKAFSLSFEFQFTYDLTNAAIRAHDECIRISPLNCRQKPKISYRLREKREEKLLMSNTNTHSRRGRFHIFSLSVIFETEENSKAWSMIFLSSSKARFLLSSYFIVWKID